MGYLTLWLSRNPFRQLAPHNLPIPITTGGNHLFSMVCALLNSLASLFRTPIVYFQYLAHSLIKTPGVAYPGSILSPAHKRKHASLQVLCLPLLRTPCRVTPLLATHTQTPGMVVPRGFLSVGFLIFFPLCPPCLSGESSLQALLSPR